MIRFSDINFRYSDAQEELLRAPELLRNAYVDANGILEDVFIPEKYLVIGAKGSGKSALSSKLQLERRWDLFVRADELEQFDFSLLEKTGGERVAGSSISVWQFLILIRFLSLMQLDEKNIAVCERLMRVSSGLEKAGLHASEDLTKIVQFTSRRGVYAAIKSVLGEFGANSSQENQSKYKDPPALVEAIKTIFQSLAPSECHFFLILDGLDYVARGGRTNFGQIADLVDAVRVVNNFFGGIGWKAKAVVLIRDEIFMRLPHANLAKRQSDNGIGLVWYENAREPFETNLMQVIEKRARLAGFDLQIEKLWSHWFDEKIDGRESVSFILDNTRYMPRDLIAFFRSLQKLNKTPKFKREDVLAALASYSDWFLQELKDALVGMIQDEVKDALPSVISSCGRRFSFDILKSELMDQCGVKESECHAIAKELFGASWIGNAWKTDKGTDRYSWAHRKRNASFIPSKEIVVHAGLWKALNLI